MTRFFVAILLVAATAAAGLAGCGDDRARYRLYGADTVIGVTRDVQLDAPATLEELARRFGIQHRELVYANPSLRTGPADAGTKVRVPSEFILPEAPRRGIVVNIAEMRLYYYPGSDDDPDEVLTFPVAVGREGWELAKGRTHVAERLVDPAWTPPASVRAAAARAGQSLPKHVPPGEDNPLGRYALRLDRSQHLIHGTDRPFSIDHAVTHGGIRLYPEDMALLFEHVREGTPVTLVDEPYKFGVRDGVYYVEAHAPATEADAEKLRERLMSRLGAHARENGGHAINWAAVINTVRVSSGVPARVSAR